jgi:hypothetical protein
LAIVWLDLPGLTGAAAVLTVAEINRLKRIGKAVDELLDKVG